MFLILQAWLGSTNTYAGLQNTLTPLSLSAHSNGDTKSEAQKHSLIFLNQSYELTTSSGEKVEINLVNRDHINPHTTIYNCLTLLIFFINEVSFACGFIGNNIKISQHVTKYNVLCMSVCVCACVRACYKIICFRERSIRNVADLIEPIRLYYRKEILLGKFYVSMDGARLL